MGMFFVMYSQTTSMLYLSWAEMGMTGAPSATVPGEKEGGREGEKEGGREREREGGREEMRGEREREGHN